MTFPPDSFFPTVRQAAMGCRGKTICAADGPWLRRLLALALVAVSMAMLPGCASLLRSANAKMASDVTTAILNQNDIETAKTSIPAYLVMLDGMIEGDSENEGLLLAAARLYGAYATSFVEDPDRARRLSVRGRDYGERALCTFSSEACESRTSLDRFNESLQRFDGRAVPVLYGYASAWAAWVQASPGNWDAIATLPLVEAAMTRVVELDETYDAGNAHLYLGVIDTRLPANLGGRPERGREHFERAIALSGGRNLMAKVMFARHYARLVFDRELHDTLVNEVLAADPETQGFTLGNHLARLEAERLRDTAEEYF